MSAHIAPEFGWQCENQMLLGSLYFFNACEPIVVQPGEGFVDKDFGNRRPTREADCGGVREPRGIKFVG